MKLDQRGSAVLGEDACRRYLAEEAAARGTGRLALNGDPSPYVIPVNFTVVRGGIVVRLGPGWAAFHLDGAAVTFEADEAVAPQHLGWSVVVEGIARVVSYEEEARMGDGLPSPIVTVPGVRVFEIVPSKVTGRAVEPDLREGLGVEGRVSAPGTMIGLSRELHLAPDEVQELSQLLRSFLGDLSSEIADTDNATYRRALIGRRLLLEGIAQQLPVSSGS